MPFVGIPRSAVPGVVWPAVPARLSALLLALLQQFEQTEWWSPKRIARHQFRQLARLLEYAHDRFPFYRERLSAAGYRRGQEITREFWSRIPVMTRRDVQEHREAIVCAELPPGHGAVSEDSTSGSMGMPLRLARSELASVLWQAITLREALWHGRDFGLKLGAIRRDRESRAFAPTGRAFPSWLSPFADVFSTGPGVMLDNRSTAAEQAAWLMREEPDHLTCFPSIIDELARFFRQHGLHLDRLKSINTWGEAVSPSLRALCREAFGVGVVDMYSATETGYIALQCPAGEHYHVQSEAVLVEVLDEAGQPCAPGTVGTVVVTPLLNYAMPLIRYAVGDYASPGEPCSCGRGLPVLREILGKTRDLLVLPSGERRYSWYGMSTFSDMPEVVQFQLVQKTIRDVEVKLVVRRPLGPDREAELRRRLALTLGESLAFTFSYHDSIPRTASGKYFTFVSELTG